MSPKREKRQRVEDVLWDVMELWYFGMSFAGSQYMVRLEGHEGWTAAAPSG